MGRMKPAQLLEKSKKKKVPAKLNVATIVIVGVVVILLLASAVVLHRRKSSDGSNESSLIDINDIDKAPEKFITTGSGEPLPRYAVKCSPQDLLHNCFRTHSFFALLNCGIQLLKPAWNRYKHSERRRYEQGFIFV